MQHGEKKNSGFLLYFLKDFSVWVIISSCLTNIPQISTPLHKSLFFLQWNNAMQGFSGQLLTLWFRDPGPSHLMAPQPSAHLLTPPTATQSLPVLCAQQMETGRMGRAAQEAWAGLGVTHITCVYSPLARIGHLATPNCPEPGTCNLAVCSKERANALSWGYSRFCPRGLVFWSLTFRVAQRESAKCSKQPWEDSWLAQPGFWPADGGQS